MLNDKKILINSIILGIVFSLKIMNASIGVPQIPVIVVCSLFLLVINFKMKFNVKYFLANCLLILISLIIFFNGEIFGNNIYLERDISVFIYYGIFTYILMQHNFNIQKTINTVIIFYAVLSLPFISHDFDSYITGDLMSVSYSVLPLFVALLVKYVALKDKFTWKSSILLIILLPYFFFLLVYCSRGVYLACIICFFLCKIVNGINKKQLLIFCLIILLVIILLINMTSILSTIEDILSSHNLSFKIIDKNLRLMQEGDISNGRGNVYRWAIDGIKNNLLFGNGIGSFNIRYSTYPHNFILQILYEGGILFLIPMIIPILYGVYAILIKKKNISKEMKVLLIFLLSSAIIRLLISYEFWKEPFFWMYLSTSMLTMLDKDIMYNKEKKNGNSNYTNV